MQQLWNIDNEDETMVTPLRFYHGPDNVIRHINQDSMDVIAAIALRKPLERSRRIFAEVLSKFVEEHDSVNMNDPDEIEWSTIRLNKAIEFLTK